MVGLMPVIPHRWAGSRMLPPVSEPSSSAEPPLAMIALLSALCVTVELPPPNTPSCTIVVELLSPDWVMADVLLSLD